MHIANNPSQVSMLSPAQTGKAAQRSGDSDSEGDGSDAVQSSTGSGGQVQQALMQALQSLGLSIPSTSAGTTSSNQKSESTDTDGGSDGATSATSGVKHDLQQFMHALFQAVKGDVASGTSASTSKTADPKAGFAAGLSAVISHVCNGSAPSDLQTAFAKLVSDLQKANPTASKTATTGGNGAAATRPTLQALLTSLQQDLGYGHSSGSGIGNSISVKA